MERKKVAILLCDEHYPEAITKFGHYVDSLFGLFDEQFELHSSWNCHLNEFPQTDEELSADIWLVSGSKYSVNDDDEWVSQLEILVQSLELNNKRLFGICFGHQMIHKALGGKVEKRKEGFAVGLEEVTVYSDSHLDIDGSSLLFMHQEEVTELGSDFKSVGYSEHCKNVITTDSKGNLTMQCHPEFSIDFFTLLCERVEFDNKAETIEGCHQGRFEYKQDQKHVVHTLNRYLFKS